MPRLADIFDCLINAKYFSKLDLNNGYYNLLIDENDIHKSSFITQDGQYEFIRVPQGLKNSPALFNKLFKKIFQNLLYSKCFIYLDDILVYGKDFNSHLSALEIVLKKLIANGLKLKPSKCHFGFSELKILDHILTKDGVKVDPDKISAILNIPIPKNVKDVQAN